VSEFFGGFALGFLAAAVLALIFSDFSEHKAIYSRCVNAGGYVDKIDGDYACLKKAPLEIIDLEASK
jgi:hypothetical protein